MFPDSFTLAGPIVVRAIPALLTRRCRAAGCGAGRRQRG
jgi:hypothetical protein